MIIPGMRLLILIRCLKNQGIPVPGTNDLETRRETRAGQSGPDRCGGMAGQVERVCKRHGAQERDRAAVDFRRRGALCRKCLGRHGGRQQQVKAVEDIPQDPIQFRTDFLNVHMVMQGKIFCPVQGLHKGSTQLRSDFFQIVIQLTAQFPSS